MARKSSPKSTFLAGRFGHVIVAIQARLPELNFITLHYAYFIFTSLLSGLIFWGSATPFRSVSFIDSLFLTTSAMTEAGLNTVNLSELNTWQQVMLFILIIMGSAIFVSIFIIFVRLKAFENAFASLKQDRVDRRLKRRATGFSRTKGFFSRSHPLSPTIISEPFANGGPDLKASEEKTLDANNRPGPGNIAWVQSTSTKAPPETYLASDKVSNEDFQERGRRLTRTEDDAIGSQLQLAQESNLDAQTQESNLSPTSPPVGHIGFAENTQFQRRTDDAYRKINKPLFSFTGVGASAAASLRPRSRSSSNFHRPSLARAAPLPGPYTTSTEAYFTSGGWISRNSQFHGLTTEERLALGGCEYRSLVFLSFLVPFYFVIWQLLGAIALGAYVRHNRESITRANGLGGFWVGAFNAISAFNNSGMSLLDANMVAFQNSVFMLLSMGLFILAGNTAYPIFLRVAVWTIWKLIPDDDPNWNEDKKTLRFLLDHPRRVYTNLFPSRSTWWLAAALTTLNGVDWAFFPILNIGNPNITQYLSPGLEAIDGLFQALAVRSGGFYVVPIPNLRISLQFLYVVMMYISAYPIVISMRNSNVYEERSLGVYVEDIQEPEEDEKVESTAPKTPTGTSERSRSNFRNGLRRRLTDISEKAAPAPKRDTISYFVRYQLRAQLAHDAWFLVFAIFLVLIIEASQFEAHPGWFSVFNIIFEIVSAYGTVGISVGVPYNAFSFCGSWHTLSKLVLIVVMIRGRHRGLPVAIDHAVQLPRAHLYDAEIEDGERRLDKIERSNTMRSQNISRSQPNLDLNTRPNAQPNRTAVADDEVVATGREDDNAQLRKPYSSGDKEERGSDLNNVSLADSSYQQH